MNTSNPRAQSEQNQANDHTIKFNCAEDGSINVCNGSTVFSDLFTIGALSLTSKHKYSSDQVWLEYQTDLPGLKTLDFKVDEALDFVSDIIRMLGIMLVYVNKKEFRDADLQTYAWLVTGLSEILNQLSREKNEISHSLLMLSLGIKPKASPADHEGGAV